MAWTQPDFVLTTIRHYSISSVIYSSTAFIHPVPHFGLTAVFAQCGTSLDPPSQPR